MPMVYSVQTVHLSCIDTNNVSKQTKTRFLMTHITYEFHRVHPKLLMNLWYVQCKPCTYLASRLALSNGPNKVPPDPRHLEVPSDASKTIYESMVRLTQTEHLSYIDANTVSNRSKRVPHDPRQLGIPSGATNTISEPTGLLTQTRHQCCIKSSTISNWIKPSFHLRLVT
jgi:hypothetical protein